MKKWICGLFALLTVLTLIVPGAAPLTETAEAVTQQDIDKLQNDAAGLVRKRKNLKSQMAELKNDRAGIVKRRQLLDEEIALTQEEISNKEAQIQGYDALLAQTELDLKENREEEARQYEIFCRRVRSMEEHGEPSYWSAILGATSFADLLSRLTDVQEVMNYDRRILEDLRTVRGEIEAKKAAQEALRQDVTDAKKVLEEKKADLDAQREEANQLIRDLEKNVAMYNEQLKEIEAEEERIQKDILKKSDELAAQMGWDTTAGGYIWPVSRSRRITSPYGPRPKPKGTQGSTNHKGVDIGGVGYDTKVLATKAGVVITSKYSNSYGNYVVVSHGRGNTTLYAHMSSRSVKEGETVTQGQVIGITGSTGHSNGPHLHYEITEGGQRVNPLQYLPGYVKAW